MAEEKILTVMADYDCGLWDSKGGMDSDDEEINAPPEFVRRFDAWLGKYDDIVEGRLDEKIFDEEGRALAVELKKNVGPSYKVFFVGECGGEEEISESED